MKPKRKFQASARQYGMYRALWADACAVTGWDVNDDEERLDMHDRVIKRRIRSSEMTNDELTQVMKHLESLANPGSLTAQVDEIRHREDPELAKREQTIHAIAKMAEAIGLTLGKSGESYIKSISDSTHKTCEWRSLPYERTACRQDLQTLRNTIADRLQVILSSMKGTRRGKARTDLVAGNPLGLTLFQPNGRPVANTDLIREIISRKQPAAAPVVATLHTANA